MMELTLRDGMVLIGSLLILAVIIDAWRRMRAQKVARVRVKLATDIPDAPAEDLTVYRELPNGGARVINRHGPAEPIDESASGIARETPSGQGRLVPKTDIPESKTEPDDPSDTEGQTHDHPSALVTIPEGKGHSAAVDTDDVTLAMRGMSATDDEPTNLDWLEDLPDANASAKEEEAGELPRDSDTEVIVLHVTAKDDRGFAGKDILEILLACDLRFGDMDFFHRHELEAGRGPIQFSVANMLQPGVFDIDQMDNMTTRGLVFFLTLPGPEDMARAFDYMLETARAVARNLSGELLDESRSVLTQQSIEHSRQQIRELERRLLARQR